MSLPNALFLFHRRQRDRLRSERVASHDEEDEQAEEGTFVNNNNDSPSTDTTAEANTPPETSGSSDVEQAPTEEEDNDNSDGESEDEPGVSRFRVQPNITLAELEEERELARRRSSACTLFALFVLFRLWILALQDGDFGLLMLCLVGTSWTARWIRYNRDQEEELDRRIANYLANRENGGENSEGEFVGRDDLRMLSFQAQLALAIMESQRQMMEGGYGHPDGGEQNPGVTEQAKESWNQFNYKAARDKKESKLGSYGSVPHEEYSKDDEPHCSICLGEYEEGEGLTKLPCNHIYHQECIDSWCSNHIRCPLCNYDLEAGMAEAV